MFRLAAPIWLGYGCKLHLVSIGTEMGPYAPDLEEAGFIIHHITTNNKSRSDCLRQFHRLIREIQPDVVHLNTEKLSMPLAFVSVINGFRTFRTVHSSFPFQGRLAVRKTIERWVMRKTGCTQISIGRSVFEHEIQQFRNPTKLIWNWFNDQNFETIAIEERTTARKSLGISDDTFAMVSIGNSGAVKNYAILLEALALYNRSNLRYYQVGFPHPEGSDLRLAQQLGVADHFVPVGPTRDVRSWLAACDVFAMPSLREGLPLAAAEALASGAKCLLADSRGLIDFKGFGIDARWLPLQPQAWVDAIEEVIETSWKSFDPASNSRIVREGFSLKKGACSYFDLWKAGHPRSNQPIFQV